MPSPHFLRPLQQPAQRQQLVRRQRLVLQQLDVPLPQQRADVDAGVVAGQASCAAVVATTAGVPQSILHYYCYCYCCYYYCCYCVVDVVVPVAGGAGEACAAQQRDGAQRAYDGDGAYGNS